MKTILSLVLIGLFSSGAAPKAKPRPTAAAASADLDAPPPLVAPKPAGAASDAAPAALVPSKPVAPAAAVAPAATQPVAAPQAPAKPAAAPTATAAAAPAAPAPAAPAAAAAAAPAAAPAKPGAPAAAPASAAKPSGPAPVAAASGEEEFNLRVKTMEEQVSDLKEKIYRTKSRLLLLQESLLGGGITQGAKAVLVHRNEMGSSFVLESVAYALDGAPVFTKVDLESDELNKKEELEIFNGRLVSGPHQVAVKMQFRGNGFGVFNYLEGYKFKLESNYTFAAEPGKITNVKIVAHEKGAVTSELKDRPAIRYDLERALDTGIKKRPAGSTAEVAR